MLPSLCLFIEGNDTCDFRERPVSDDALRTGPQRARQTTGDIPGVPPDSRGIRRGVTRTDSYAIFRCTTALPGVKYARRHIGTRDQNVITLSINDFQRRTQILPPVVRSAESRNHQRRQTGQFVGLTRNGSTAIKASVKRMKPDHFGDNR